MSSTQFDDLKTLMEEMMNNHLAHIQSDIDSLKLKMNLVLFVLGTLFTAAVATYLKKI